MPLTQFIFQVTCKFVLRSGAVLSFDIIVVLNDASDSGSLLRLPIPYLLRLILTL